MLALTTQQSRPIPRGEAGIWQSVGGIRALIRSEAARPIVRTQVAAIVAGVAPNDHDERLRRILAWVKLHLEYLPDPVGVEAVGRPSYHIGNIRSAGQSNGDCDDAAALTGALARAVGRKVRLQVASFLPSGRLHHIWSDGLGATGWVEMDPFRGERFRRAPVRLVSVEV